LFNLIVNEEFKTFVSNKVMLSEEETLLEIENLSCEPYYRNISFSIRKGEILGIAGLTGSGKSELCQSLFGIHKNVSGVVKLNGKVIKLSNPSDMKSKGIFLLPQNRKTEGLFLNDQIKDNIISTVLKKMTDLVFLRQRRIKQTVKDFVNLLNIKMDSINQFVRFLSGGNQQKVLVAKSIAPNPKLLIALDPTRGIDVGSKADIDHMLLQLSNQGMTVLTISSELEELTNTCDRILVMNKGMFNAESVRSEFDNREILYAIHK
jgi:ribose transport system ATP-binding protein